MMRIFFSLFRHTALPVLLAAAILMPRDSLAARAGLVRTPSGPVITLELSKGGLIRLPGAANSVFIADPEIADVTVKSPRLIYVFGKKTGETTLFAVDKKENVLASIPLRITHNLGRLNAELRRLLPGGDIQATSVAGGIVLTGAVETAVQSENARRLAARFLGETEEVINRLAVTAPNQVNLRVRIAEVSRSVLNQFGINWEAAFDGAITFGIATGSPVIFGSRNGFNTISPSPGGSQAGFLTRQLEGQVNNSNGFFRATPGPLDLNVLIDSLAQDGLISILAEPNLTALSGETASFLAGGEFPIPVSQSDNRITIEFKQFGVSLSFTPTLIGDNRISMRVRPEVSELSDNGAIQLSSGLTIPAIATRRAETTVELGSGQSFAIAGLLTNNSKQIAEKVPGLSNLPILGPLFNSNRFERNESELMIIVTPYVVQPVSRRIALPTDPLRRKAKLAAVPPAPSEKVVVPVPGVKSGAGFGLE